MTWAVGHKIPALQKLVLLMLANRSNHDTGKCIPKIKALAEECGMSERSVQRAIQELDDAGLLKIVHRFHEGVQLSNQYNLCLWVRGELEIKHAPVAPSWHPVVPHSHPVVPDRRTEPRIEPVIEPTPPTPRGELSDGFAEFWKAYPKKVAPDAAQRAWNRKVKTPETIKAILEAVKTQAQSDAWKKEGGQFVPNPATWLNAGRWKDEMPGECSAAADWSKGAV